MKEIRWNEGWKFWEDHDSFALIWDVPEEAEEVRLPHDAMRIKKANMNSLNGTNTGYRDGDCYIYRKELYVPTAEKDLLHVLKFEGVYMNAFVYVNGQMCAKSPFGYSTFYANLDTYLKYDAVNEIRVQVRSGAMTNSRWYSGAGIYRDVYLLTSHKTHIVPEGVFVKTERLEDHFAVAVIETEIENQQSERIELVVHNALKDDNGTILCEEKSIISLGSGETTTIRQRVNVKNIEKWDSEHPYLYHVDTVLYAGNVEVDHHHIMTGFRTLDVDSERGFRVNGEEVLLRGACIHHDSGILGASTYDEIQYRQVKRLKEAGFNAIRMAHQPAAPALLRACDELGMYVMDEYTDIWNRMKSFYDYGLYFEEWWQKDITAMVRKDRNHPCVVMYSIGNEIPEIGTDQGASVCHRLNEKVKELDTTRFTLASINGVFAAGDSIEEILSDFKEDIETPDGIGNVNTFMALMGKKMDQIVVHPAITRKLEKALPHTDIAGYNYMTARYRMDHEHHPNRVIVGSETYPASIARNWNEVKQLSHVIGDFTWTGWDYLGEAGGGIPKYEGKSVIFDEEHIPQTAYGGDLDLIGVRMPTSYYRSIVFGVIGKPYIAVQDPQHVDDKLLRSPWMLTDAQRNYHWPGYEHKPLRVEVYSNAEVVALYQNGKCIEKKVVGEEMENMVVFHITYEPGELKAVNVRNGNEAEVDILYTTGEEQRIILQEEEITTKYGLDNQLVCINISVVDERDHEVFDNNCEIKIELEGCELMGFGSGNPMPTHNFDENITHLHHGHALAIIRKTSDEYNVNVTMVNPSSCS